MVSIVLKTLFEAALVGFTLWALFNEDKFITFEERLKAAIRRRRLRVYKKTGVSSEIRLYSK